MSVPGGPDKDTTVYASRRERSSSLTRWTALLIIALGIAVLASVLANLYIPEVRSPVGINPLPLFGLTNATAAGTVTILFGTLAYLYARRAGV